MPKAFNVFATSEGLSGGGSHFRQSSRSRRTNTGARQLGFFGSIDASVDTGRGLRLAGLP